MWPRWVRLLSTLWVALDSKKRKLDYLWVVVVLLFGPLLLPFYIACRPLLPGEKRADCFLWNLFTAFEQLLVWLVTLVTGAVFIENMSTPKSKDLAEVKRAEIKAGSILSVIVFIFALGLERFGFDAFKRFVERKYFNL